MAVLVNNSISPGGDPGPLSSTTRASGILPRSTIGQQSRLRVRNVSFNGHSPWSGAVIAGVL